MPDERRALTGMLARCVNPSQRRMRRASASIHMYLYTISAVFKFIIVTNRF